MSVTLLWAALRDAWTNSDETVKLKVNLRAHGSLSTLSLCLNQRAGSAAVKMA